MKDNELLRRIVLAALKALKAKGYIDEIPYEALPEGEEPWEQ